MKIHTIICPFHCDLCSEMFLSSSLRSRHIQIYSSEMKCSCQNCSKSFAKKLICLSTCRYTPVSMLPVLHLHQYVHQEESPYMSRYDTHTKEHLEIKTKTKNRLKCVKYKTKCAWEDQDQGTSYWMTMIINLRMRRKSSARPMKKALR